MPCHCYWIMVTSAWIFVIIMGSAGGCFMSVSTHVFLITIKAKLKYMSLVEQEAQDEK